MKRLYWLQTALVLTIGWSSCACFAQDQALIDQAIREYEAGRYEAAIPLLLKDLRVNGSGGKAHEYLTLAMKKLGQPESAVGQLEMAAKFCPPGMIESVAKEALAKEGVTSSATAQTPPPAAAPAKPAPNDFMGMLSSMGNNIAQTFGMGAPSSSGAASKPADVSMMPMPDLFGGMRDALKQGKRWIKKNVSKAASGGKHSQGFNTSADVIPMHELMELVDESKNSKWQSHPDGVAAFDQAPEYSPEWDAWIKGFRRQFNHRLLRRMATKAKDEQDGMAGVVFSLDNSGHLRGRIYTSTANDTLNDCLLQTIRDMNGTSALTFPANTSVTGWNFRMRWNFAKFLAVIKQFRARQMLAKIAANSAYHVMSTDAKIARAKEVEAQKAIAKKLAADKATALAKLVPTSPNFKTNVSGQIMPGKPTEMKATAMKLGDVRPGAAAPAAVEPLNFDEITPQEAEAIDRMLESP